MTQNPQSEHTARDIAAGIDLDTAEGHDLRAHLLRYLFNSHLDKLTAATDAAEVYGEDLGLIEYRLWELTPLGSEVAELLRPEPWRVGPYGNTWAVFAGVLDNRPHALAASRRDTTDAGFAFCTRLAALLTADDLARAMRYLTPADLAPEPE